MGRWLSVTRGGDRAIDGGKGSRGNLPSVTVLNSLPSFLQCTAKPLIIPRCHHVMVILGGMDNGRIHIHLQHVDKVVGFWRVFLCVHILGLGDNLGEGDEELVGGG